LQIIIGECNCQLRHAAEPASLRIHTYIHTYIMYVCTHRCNIHRCNINIIFRIYAGAASLGIVKRFARDLQPPTLAEGFGSVVVCIYILNMDIQYIHMYMHMYM